MLSGVSKIFEIKTYFQISIMSRSIRGVSFNFEHHFLSWLERPIQYQLDLRLLNHEPLNYGSRECQGQDILFSYFLSFNHFYHQKVQAFKLLQTSSWVVHSCSFVPNSSHLFIDETGVPKGPFSSFPLHILLPSCYDGLYPRGWREAPENPMISRWVQAIIDWIPPWSKRRRKRSHP